MITWVNKKLPKGEKYNMNITEAEQKILRLLCIGDNI
jgi:hypothetical protein